MSDLSDPPIHPVHVVYFIRDGLYEPLGKIFEKLMGLCFSEKGIFSWMQILKMKTTLKIVILMGQSSY